MVLSVAPSTGWGVLHSFYHLRRELLSGAEGAARDFAARVQAFDDRDGCQVLAFSVLGQKADFGLMALSGDLAALDGFSIELAGSPLGQALLPAASYLSLTEESGYTSTEEDEVARLEAEGIPAGTEEHAASLEEFRTRMNTYREHKLHPQLPRRRCISFYPMSKRRQPDQNWYELEFAERKRLMSGHARVGRRHRDKVLQLITGSVGLDDWEWGVTLFADDPVALKDVVYDMRFDTVSARYSEFGPFVTGLVTDPFDLMRHLHVA
jgi:hydrogen peroxide-dependent heme synthase